MSAVRAARVAAAGLFPRMSERRAAQGRSAMPGLGQRGSGGTSCRVLFRRRAESGTGEGAIPDEVVEAAVQGDDAVLVWLDGGGRVDATFTHMSVSGNAVLILSRRRLRPHERLAAQLLQRGASVDLQNNENGTALILAARNGHKQVAELLLQHGAEINLQDCKDHTALMLAAFNNYPAVVLRLLRAGADAKLRSVSGDTALGFAKKQGHSE